MRGDEVPRHQGGMSDPTALLPGIGTCGGKKPKSASALHNERLDPKRAVRDR
jgi:hypothetical protein